MERHQFIRTWLTFPGGLATRLQAIRQDAGIRSAALARQLDWPRSKVTKIERGDQFPSVEDITAWCEACDASGEASRLIDQRDASWKLHLEHRSAGDDGPPTQALYSQLMETSRVVSLVETMLVPGPLQVPAYARAVLAMSFRRTGRPLDRLDEEVAERVGRARFLGLAGLELRFLVHEAALRLIVDTPETMLSQLDRLQSVVDHPHVRFGILPFSAPLAEMPRAFGLYDQLVTAETMGGDLVHAGGTEAEQYRSVERRLWANAVEGDQARKLLLAAASSHRQATDLGSG